MATLEQFETVAEQLRAATLALPAATGKFLGMGGSKVYNKATATQLGNNLIQIAEACADALRNEDTVFFRFKDMVGEIDALLNIRMVINDKRQIQTLKNAALALKEHCGQTPSIDVNDAHSTKEQWAGHRAIDLVVDELLDTNLGKEDLVKAQHKRELKRLSGPAQFIINNTGTTAEPEEGWNASKRANIAAPLRRVPKNSRDFVGYGKAVAIDPKQAGSLAICHATAAGMLNLLGRKHQTYQAGGAGPELREAARELALRLLDDDDKLYLLQFKCTAEADGHSFMLCMNANGTVTRAESWANPSGNGLFLERQLGKMVDNTDVLSKSQARRAVERIFSASSVNRDKGYDVLSDAYDGCILYELKSHAEEHDDDHTCDAACRAPDDVISIVVKARQLSSPQTVRNRLKVLRDVYDAIEVPEE